MLKLFEDKQSNKQTLMEKQHGQKLYSPDLSMQGHKKTRVFLKMASPN